MDLNVGDLIKKKSGETMVVFSVRKSGHQYDRRNFYSALINGSSKIIEIDQYDLFFNEFEFIRNL